MKLETKFNVGDRVNAPSGFRTGDGVFINKIVVRYQATPPGQKVMYQLARLEAGKPAKKLGMFREDQLSSPTAAVPAFTPVR